jgi:hypothetical protein
LFSNFSKFGEALKSILSETFNGDVIMEPVNTAFQYAVKQTENNLKFPFISFYPNSNILLDNSNNSMDQYHDGIDFQNPLHIYNEDGTLKGTNERLAKNQNFLYIIIGYQIEIWGTDRLSTEEVVQELVFWLYENQQVSLKLMGETLNFSFSIDNQIIDNSDLTSYQSQGKLYRYTLSIELQGVLLRTKNFFTLLHPIIKVEEMKKNKKGE